MGWLNILGFGTRQVAEEKDDEQLGLLFSEITRLLEGLKADEVKVVTGYAGLLGKVAYADMEISKEEIQNIRRVLREVLALDESPIAALIQILTEHRVQLFSVEDHLYTRLVNEVLTYTEKLKLLEALFSLAAADDDISQQEDAAIWTVAKGLKLSHGDFIASRKRFQKYLAVLRTTPRE